MSDRTKKLERLKTVIIVALLISAVLLALESGILSGFLGFPSLSGRLRSAFSGKSVTIEEHDGHTVLSEAARPVAIAVTDGSERLAARYEDDIRDALYDKTAPVFAEALGSGSTPERTDDAEWRAALASPGLFYEYRTDIAMPVLCSWLGIDSASYDGFSACRLCLSGSRLYFGNSGGEVYVSDTAVVGDPAAGIGAGGCQSAFFAFELDALDGKCDPYLLLLPQAQYHPVFGCENPMASRSAREDVMTALGGSVFISSGYIESDGTAVYVANDFTLRIDSAGRAVYHLTTETPAEETTAAEAIEAARRLCSTLVSPYVGAASLSFSGIDEADGVYTVYFDYTAAGGTICVSGSEHAATATVAGATVTELTLALKTVTSAGETAALLPEIQAAAASDGAFELIYEESGGILVPKWVERAS